MKKRSARTKRSRKKSGNIRVFEEKSYNDASAAYGGIGIDKKTDTNGYEGVLVRGGSNRYGRWVVEK